MKKTIIVAAAAGVIALSGCGSESSVADSSSTPVASATAIQTSVAKAVSESAPTEAADPQSTRVAESGRALYMKMCADMSEFFSSFEELGTEVGPTDRAKAAEEFAKEMQASPEWDLYNEADQKVMLDGLAAASAGDC
ncbi:hypothetical protein ACWFRB_09105 [Rhodococcus sp. NPDC055112]